MNPLTRPESTAAADRSDHEIKVAVERRKLRAQARMPSIRAGHHRRLPCKRPRARCKLGTVRAALSHIDKIDAPPSSRTASIFTLASIGITTMQDLPKSWQAYAIAWP